MPYTTKNVLNKTKPYKCIKIIEAQPNGSYPTQIAKEIGVQQPTASDILSSFLELGLVKKGKRKKAQHYTIDKDGFWVYHNEIVDTEIFNVSRKEFMDFFELYLSHVETSTVTRLMEDWTKQVLARSNLSDKGDGWLFRNILDLNPNVEM